VGEPSEGMKLKLKREIANRGTVDEDFEAYIYSRKIVTIIYLHPDKVPKASHGITKEL
jgi:hypothetical protein